MFLKWYWTNVGESWKNLRTTLFRIVKRNRKQLGTTYVCYMGVAILMPRFTPPVCPCHAMPYVTIHKQQKKSSAGSLAGWSSVWPAGWQPIMSYECPGTASRVDCVLRPWFQLCSKLCFYSQCILRETIIIPWNCINLRRHLLHYPNPLFLFNSRLFSILNN